MSIQHPITGASLPDGWSIATVEEIKSPKRGSCVAGPFGSNISSKYFQPDGVPVIRGSNLTDDLTRFIDDGFVFISEEYAAGNFENQRVVAGDLVFTCWGTVGQVGIIPGSSKYPSYIISNKQLKLRIDERKAMAEYVFYYFAQQEAVAFVRSRAVGAAVPGINLGILKTLPVVLPPLPVQRAIASALNAYEQLIENNRRRIRVLETLMATLYADSLRRHGTRRACLSSIAEVNPDSLRPESGSSYHYVDIASVSPGDIQLSEPMQAEQLPGRARRGVKDGDSIWSCVRPNRRSYAPIVDPPSNMVVSTGFAVIRPLKCPSAVLYLALTRDDFVKHLESRARGSAYPAVTATDFDEAEIELPAAALTEALQSNLKPMLSLKASLSRRNATLRKLRDLLLPKLLSGEIDVSRLPLPPEESA